MDHERHETYENRESKACLFVPFALFVDFVVQSPSLLAKQERQLQLDPIGRVTWSREAPTPVKSLAELDALLDQLARDYPGDDAILVDVENLAGDGLAIGLGKDYSVLGFTSASGEPPYLVSKGFEASDELLVFYFQGHWTEFSMRNAIPISVARAAVREFLVTGKLTNTVEWEEV